MPEIISSLKGLPMTVETRRFDVGAVLSVTTGKLLTVSHDPNDNGIGRMCDLLGWMTNDTPFTHQLGRFIDECKPWLLRWFPELARIKDTDFILLKSLIKESGPQSGCEKFLEAVCALHSIPKEFDIPRIAAESHVKNTLGQVVDDLMDMLE